MIKLTTLLLLLAVSTARAGTAELERITAVVQPYVDRHELAGAVTLITSKDKVLDLATIGYADVKSAKPMQPDTLFWIASMSKPITATALMMLVDEGKVRLDDPVDQYLPEFTPRIMSLTADGAHVRLSRPQHPITLRRLLSHTSGLRATSTLEEPTRDTLPLAVRVESYALEPLMFEPGESYAYANAGINTIGRVIEVVSGMRFEDFLQQRLFTPLGMNDTTFRPTEAQLQRLAKAYQENAQDVGLQEVAIAKLRYPLSDSAHRYPVPAGGLFSTAADLAKFCQMLLNGGALADRRYVSETSLHEMTRNQLSESTRQVIAAYRAPDGSDGYGLGWSTSSSLGTFGHGGAYGTDMNLDPRRGLAIIWLVQDAGYSEKVVKAESDFMHLIAQRLRDTAGKSGTSP